MHFLLISESAHNSKISTLRATLLWKPGLNPGRRGGKPATNRLSYGAALLLLLLLLFGLWGYWHCGHSWPIVPASGDSEDDYGEADGL
jgi:hypothetical protein